MIINGELQNGIGGGVCQVSTTVFNAAFEAGLSIEERTNHALYILSSRPGRDATVNYPDLDLEFSNDTVEVAARPDVRRGRVADGSTSRDATDRRVETEIAPLEVDGKAPGEAHRRPDDVRGQTEVVDDFGATPEDRHPAGLRAEWGAAVRDHLELVLRRRARPSSGSGRSRGRSRWSPKPAAKPTMRPDATAPEAPRTGHVGLHRFRR